ncbi:hypothetical protein SAMN05216249_1316 [Acetitomaculum ruminis DSM 5522]|uniref:Uncharacterized protein n=1 Tax=Acetitomaculum ruminis DSM 5522 TaxID=1120918 RepID=A0A1I1AL94_9FIRM|nr:hypothetical protein [Acetitomaculum ruminis]SFB38811.1 hypothetical protein SAMN05216249_1316 [Acetitomaculum ruminis DSM 5522]
MEEKFTMKLAYFDMVPVIIFGVAFGILGMKLESLLFVFGSVICTLAGLGKVFWKIFIASKEKEISFLYYQFRFLMPIGFFTLIIAVLFTKESLRIQLFQEAFKFPSVFCFAMGIMGMIVMFICAFKIDKHDVKGNWLEQSINTIAQAFFMMGILLL